MRDQFLIVERDEERAVKALPRLLPEDTDERERGLDVVHRAVSARGTPSAEAKRRSSASRGHVRSPARAREAQERRTEASGGAVNVWKLNQPVRMKSIRGLVSFARTLRPVITAVVHPCDEASMAAAREARQARV